MEELKKSVALLLVCASVAGANLGERRIYDQAQQIFTFLQARDPDNFWDPVSNTYTLNGQLVVTDVNVTNDLSLETFTEGSVLFTGAAGLVKEDNTNFFWNDSTNVLKIAGFTLDPGTDTDGVMNFTGTTNSGILTWMEDEDYFKFSDDVLLDTGIWYFQETTTPSAIASHGSIYTKADNGLYFQSGDGIEHLLHGDAFSNIWFHSPSSVEVAIAVQGDLTKIDSFTVVGHEDDGGNVVGSVANDNLTLSSDAGGEYELSYHGSITATGGADKEMGFAVGITLATPKDITNVTDDTVTPIVITSVAHGLENGDMVEIVGVLVNTAANGSFIVDSKADDTFAIVNLDGSATTGNGDYDEGAPTGDVTIFYPGNLEVHRMVRGADFGSISATAFHVLADNDVLSLYVTNLSGTTNLTVSSVSFGVNRIGD